MKTYTGGLKRLERLAGGDFQTNLRLLSAKVNPAEKLIKIASQHEARLRSTTGPSRGSGSAACSTSWRPHKDLRLNSPRRGGLRAPEDSWRGKLGAPRISHRRGRDTELMARYIQKQNSVELLLAA